MLKNIIAPVQTWLLSQGKCVGCGMSLASAQEGKAKNGSKTVICKCRRVYVGIDGKRFRRAGLDEV